MNHVGVVGKCKKFHSYVLVESVDLLSLNASIRVNFYNIEQLKYKPTPSTNLHTNLHANPE
jgi:hypothetical protein